jgi:hypothetical protein
MLVLSLYESEAKGPLCGPSRSPVISAGRLTLRRDTPNEIPLRSSTPPLGRVVSVRGSQVTIGLLRRTSVARPTVGKFMGIQAGTSVLAGVITMFQRMQPPARKNTMRQQILIW